MERKVRLVAARKTPSITTTSLIGPKCVSLIVCKSFPWCTYPLCEPAFHCCPSHQTPLSVNTRVPAIPTNPTSDFDKLSFSSWVNTLGSVKISISSWHRMMISSKSAFRSSMPLLYASKIDFCPVSIFDSILHLSKYSNRLRVVSGRSELLVQVSE